MQISNYLAAGLLNFVLRNQPFTPPETVYIALYTSDPTPNDTGTEVNGGGYVRQPITFSEPVLEDGMQTVKNIEEIKFPVATDDWGLITHVGLRTAATGGKLLWYKAIQNPRSIQAGDRPIILKDGTTVRFTN